MDANHCEGCKHSTSVQGYLRACASPSRLAELKRMYYAPMQPVQGCKETKHGK
jgi:hypothetical protein